MSLARWLTRGPLAAVALTSVLPVPAGAHHPGPRVVVWLPVVGAVLGALAYLPALAVWRGGDHGASTLAAVLVITALAGLTRGLHLDGLADLADGLGSGRSGAAALEVMRRSDIGPFGVVTVVSTVLIQISALAEVLVHASRPAAAATVVIAVTTGRAAIVLAAGIGIPASAGSRLGALVAGSVPRSASVGVLLGLMLVAVTLPTVTGAGVPAAVATTVVVATALWASVVLRRRAVARLGGVSGDVFGALVEVATTVVLLGSAAQAVWR